jgi:hypothetical protein
MKKMTSIIALVAIFVLAGCGVTAPVSNSDDYSDLSVLSVCGDFPLATAGSGPNTHYFVCRAADDGQCYYQKISFEQIEGCDPEFDKYDYGKEECFGEKTRNYSFDGVLLQSVSLNSNDDCAPTTQTYFESKISE